MRRSNCTCLASNLVSAMSFRSSVIMKMVDRSARGCGVGIPQERGCRGRDPNQTPPAWLAPVLRTGAQACAGEAHTAVGVILARAHGSSRRVFLSPPPSSVESMKTMSAGRRRNGALSRVLSADGGAGEGRPCCEDGVAGGTPHPGADTALPTQGPHQQPGHSTPSPPRLPGRAEPVLTS